MKIKTPPMIIDNTVISRFGFTDRFDILEKLYASKIVIPTNVIIESIVTSPLEKCVQAALKNKWMEEYTLEYKNSVEEIKEYTKLRKKFGDGECAVMAIAKTWNCTVASDDLRATRKFCKEHNIDQIGCLGILYDTFDSGIITLEEGDALLNDMIVKSHYTCPVNHFDNIIQWFKNGIGRELF